MTLLTLEADADLLRTLCVHSACKRTYVISTAFELLTVHISTFLMVLACDVRATVMSLGVVRLFLPFQMLLVQLVFFTTE